jgi:hypothetical protein
VPRAIRRAAALALALLAAAGLAASSVEAAPEPCCRQAPNPDLPRGMGRVVVAFPPGSGTERTPIHLFEKETGGRLHKSDTGKLDLAVSPGTYALTVNKVVVARVPVTAGFDTVVRTGVLHIDAPAGTTTYVGRSGRAAVTAFTGGGLVGLPVGAYDVAWRPEPAPSQPRVTRTAFVREGATVLVAFGGPPEPTAAVAYVANSALPAGSGRIVVVVPEGVRTAETPVAVWLGAEPTGTPAATGGIALSPTLRAGTYVATLHKVRVLDVRVEPGHDARLRVGALRLAVPSGSTVRVGRAGRGFVSAFVAPGDVLLPVGTYDVEWVPAGRGATRHATRVVVGDGEVAVLRP